MEKRTSDHDIDLLEVLAKIYQTLRNNKLLVILCPLFGLTAGIALSQFSKEKVKARMMIETDLINQSESKFLIEQLENTDSILALAESHDVRVKYEIKPGEQGDKNIYFIMSTVTPNKGDLSLLQGALINYLNNSEPIARRRVEKEEMCKNMIKKIDSELVFLDEVKRQIDNKSKATFLEPATLFEKAVDLYNKRLAFQIDLQNAQSVHVVKGFGTLTTNAKWSRFIFAAIGLIFGLFLLVVVLFLRFFNKYYKEFEKANAS